MDHHLELPAAAKAIGYGWLSVEFGLSPLQHHVRLFIGDKSERRKIEKDGVVAVIFPKRTEIRDDWLGHLEFALKHEGLHFTLLRQLFPKLDPDLLVEALRRHPTGMYLRKIWYLYEAITGQKLPVRDLTQGNYVDLLDPKHYYTSFRFLVKRQRINQNLLGDLPFCGIVRKTSKLREFEDADLANRCREVIDSYRPEMFDRAMNYLYRKETKSSYEIENETPDQKRAGKFVELLRGAEKGEFFTRKVLTELQHLIVDERFANKGYRDDENEQVYVGQSLTIGREIVHFVGPKPGDVRELMEGWAEMARILSESEDLHPVIAAAVVAFAFVFIHPFSDGNGRIHRFLIHHVLAKRGFAPRDVIFPVSAVMVKRPRDYDASLESFSRPLMECVEYELDEVGEMTVLNETIDYYRAIDYTEIAELLFEFVSETIKTELPEEFSYLESYDVARREMRSVVDLPERLADLLISLILQNKGTLSGKKRHFKGIEKLTDAEISEFEAIVSKAFKLQSGKF